MTLRDELILATMRRAMAEPIGLLLQTQDPKGLRQIMYRIRSKYGDSSLVELQIRFSPLPDGDLILCHPPQAPSQ